MAAGIPLSPTHPADPYAWAVQAAQREYPRLTQYPPMRLTYNPRREGYSETFPATGEDAKYPGQWTVEMGESPYYYKPSSWPGMVALESLHMMQAIDPRYQQMTAQLQKTIEANQQQMEAARRSYAQAQVPGPYGKFSASFDKFLPGVYVPEFIRGRMFGPLFRQVEGAGAVDRYNMTPEQQKLIDQIEQYMRTTGR